MTFNVLSDISLETLSGIVNLKQGQMIGLSKDEALPLIEAGLIMPTGRVAYRIYSELLQTHLWVCETDHDMHSLRAEGVAEPIYTGEEIRKLKGMDNAGLKAIHTVKTVFENSRIEEART